MGAPLLPTRTMLEAYVAAGAFLLWILLFKLAALLTPLRRFGDARIGGGGAAGEQRWLEEAAPDGVRAPARVGRTAAIWSAAFRIASSSDVICVLSLPTYILGIAVFHSYFPKRSSGEASANSMARVVIELGVGIVLYDFIFFWLHLAMHKNRTLFRLVHARHHTHRWLMPGSTVVHNLVDGAMQVGVNMFVQQLSPWGVGTKLLASRLLHNVVVTFMLVEAHSEFDCVFSLHNLAPSIFGGSLRHRYHHARGKGTKAVFFQQFFRYLDDYFGFTVSDAECRHVCFAPRRFSSPLHNNKARIKKVPSSHDHHSKSINKAEKSPSAGAPAACFAACRK